MNLVVVDDHPIMRAAVRHACEHEPTWRVIGETGSGAAAIEMILQLQPDALAIDLVLDDLTGFIVAERVRKHLPALRILVLSEWLKEYVVIRLAQLGVQGFISKRNARTELLHRALRALAEGGSFFSDDFRTFQRERCADPLACTKILSRAEQRVLAFVGQFKSDAEIANLLGIAPTTAQTHRSHLLHKLNLPGTPQLIAYAQRSGFALAAGDILCEIVAEEITTAADRWSREKSRAMDLRTVSGAGLN